MTDRLRDVSGRDLGVPHAVERPTTTDEVAAIVRRCRAERRAVVPFGARTAYWWPLRLDGAVALDTSGLQGVSVHGDLVEVGAGALVRPLDEALRARGLHLPFHPDAFGDTPVGALAASAATSGVGMGQGPFSRWVAGLEVVTGAGEVLRTGAGGAWPGRAPLMRDGVPDVTGLMLGAEGTLGVITRLWLRVPPAPWRAHARVIVEAERAIEMLEVGRGLVARGVIDTWRSTLQSDHDPHDAWVTDVWVTSPAGEDEVIERAHGVAVALSAFGPAHVEVEGADARAGEGPIYARRWGAPGDSHARFMAHAALVGMDVNAAYDAAPGLLALASEIVEEQLAQPFVLATRRALYLAPDFLNLGLHAAAALTPEAIAWSHGHVRRRLADLWRHEVLPYRPGRAWPPEVHAAVRPEVRALWQAIRRHLDPDGVMHPDHPLLPA